MADAAAERISESPRARAQAATHIKAPSLAGGGAQVTRSKRDLSHGPGGRDRE